jgi:N-acetylglucosaminyldiphosphoundecaprenol N-acetyl-beta-D-mannosaminyltransferase
MRKPLLSIQITIENYNTLVQKILSIAKQHISSYICVANVHMTVEAHKSKTFRAAVNGADIVTADGMPLVKSLQLLYGIKQERIAGMDLLPDLLRESENIQIPVYFYGSSPETISRTENFLHQNFPTLNIVGTYSPPFRSLTFNEEMQVIKTINNSRAELVFVALGCPKQETWMASMKGKINACMIGIGGALPVLIGEQKRAPAWMQKNCLEWLYRLSKEPGRLFKRYAITNTTFLWLLAKAWIKIKFSRTKNNVENHKEFLHENILTLPAQDLVNKSNSYQPVESNFQNI